MKSVATRQWQFLRSAPAVAAAVFALTLASCLLGVYIAGFQTAAAAGYACLAAAVLIAAATLGAFLIVRD